MLILVATVSKVWVCSS